MKMDGGNGRFEDASCNNNHPIVFISFASKLTNSLSIMIMGGIASVAISYAKLIVEYIAMQLNFNNVAKRCIKLCSHNKEKSFAT